MITVTLCGTAYLPSSRKPAATRAFVLSLGIGLLSDFALPPKTRTYGAPSVAARSMKRRASPNSFSRLAGSSTYNCAELLTQAICNLLARISFLVCSIRFGAKVGNAGKSNLPSRPRSSMAANPCCVAKSRIFFHSHPGQPSVENASGIRLGFVSLAFIWPTTIGVNTADESSFRNSRRLFILALELSLLQLLHCVVTGSRGQGHVGQRGIHAGGRNHGAAVCDEKILDVVRLIIGVQDRSPGIPAHPSRAHLMNRKAGRLVVGEGLDVVRSGRCEHLRSGNRHILSERELIFTKCAVDLQHWNSPRVNFFFVEFHEVIVVRQTLAEAAKNEPPGPRLADRFLEFQAESRLRDPPLPAFPMGAPLETIASQEAGLPGLHVAKSRNVDPVWPSPYHHPIFIPGNGCRCASGLHMVHQVVSQLPARVR